MTKQTRILSLGFENLNWTFKACGKFLLVKDPRALWQVFHPWEVSQSGDFGALTARVTIPADWPPPILLNLYAGDTYVCDGWDKAKPNWTHTYAAAHFLPGHRFKQVLVNATVVWEQDIGDAEDFGYFQLDLSPHITPGTAFQLTLRVLDKVGTATHLPGDEFRLGIWSWEGLKDPKSAAQKLYTRVFWGDLAASSPAAVPWGKNPVRRDLKLDPIRPAPAKPAGTAAGKLILDCPNGLPADGYPVSWGVPFGAGRLPEGTPVALLAPDGRPIPIQTQVLARWPGNSIRWLLLDFLAPAGAANQPLTLRYGADVKQTPDQPGLEVKQEDGRIMVNTGALSFSVRTGAALLLEEVTPAGETEPLGKSLTAEVVARDGWDLTCFAPRVEQAIVEAAGAERVTILCAGRLVSGDRGFGRFTCRVHAYRGKAYLRVFYRIFNDCPQPAQLVDEFTLRLNTTLTDGEAVLGNHRLRTGAAETERLLVRQHKCDAFEVFQGDDKRLGAGTHWAGPVTLQTAAQGVSGQVRGFAPQYPKRQWAGWGGQLVFDLFSRTIECEQYVMTRGEAKRHELLLVFHKGPADLPAVQALCRTFERPPVLLSPAWYAGHEAFGRAAPLTPETLPELHAAVPELRRKPNLTCTVPIGLRNWPDGYSDSIYNAYRGTWQNMYQEVDYGAHILALLAGNRDWFDYAEAYQRHFMDLDICHHHPNPAFVGACYGIASGHTGSHPYSLNAPLGGLFLLHHLTGDPDAHESAVGIADWVCATNLGVGESSGRAVGWPLRSLMLAYENTQDSKYLAAGRKLAESALAVLDSRRGFFSEPGATWHYRGGSPGMNAILAAGLMRYWRASGDERAGQAVANIACNTAYAWMSPREPGLLLALDPLQQVFIAGYALQDILPLFWGYELTGDAAFLDQGARMMRESILHERWNGAAFGLSRYWELPDTLHYYALARQRAQPTPPDTR